MHEIERKFLLNRPLEQVLAVPHTVALIEQCYLGKTGEWTVRARRSISPRATSCFLTLKKRETDRTSVEIETAIDMATYEKMCAQSVRAVRKTRHTLQHGDHTWEIDLFEHGLVLAEIELQAEDEAFLVPEWLGADVTHDKAYRSNQIAKDLTSRA